MSEEGSEENIQDTPKTFLGHLEDLRKMLLRMAVALGIAMVLCFIKGSLIIQLYLDPLKKIQGLADPRQFLQFLGVADSFTLQLQMAFYAGLVVAFPFLLYFIGQFVMPALTARERRYIFIGLVPATGLFALGAAFAYFWLLPITLDFFYREALEMGFEPKWAVMDYFSFVSNFVLAFGLAFELPVVVLILNRFGLLPYSTLSKGRRFAVVIIVIFAAVITPTSDAFTLMALAVPLTVLYEACIWIAWIMERRKQNDESSDQG